MVENREKMIVTETTPMGSNVPPVDRAHERRDINTKAIIQGIAGVFVTMVAVAVLLYFVFNLFEGQVAARDVAPGPVEDTVSAPRGPHLQPSPMLNVTPRQDMVRYRAYEDSMLRGHGWVDSSVGTRRISIDSAIRVVAGRQKSMAKSSTVDSASIRASRDTTTGGTARQNTNR